MSTTLLGAHGNLTGRVAEVEAGLTSKFDALALQIKGEGSHTTRRINGLSSDVVSLAANLTDQRERIAGVVQTVQAVQKNASLAETRMSIRIDTAVENGTRTLEARLRQTMDLLAATTRANVTEAMATSEARTASASAALTFTMDGKLHAQAEAARLNLSQAERRLDARVDAMGLRIDSNVSSLASRLANVSESLARQSEDAGKEKMAVESRLDAQLEATRAELRALNSTWGVALGFAVGAVEETSVRERAQISSRLTLAEARMDRSEHNASSWRDQVDLRFRNVVADATTNLTQVAQRLANDTAASLSRHDDAIKAHVKAGLSALNISIGAKAATDARAAALIVDLKVDAINRTADRALTASNEARAASSEALTVAQGSQGVAASNEATAAALARESVLLAGNLDTLREGLRLLTLLNSTSSSSSSSSPTSTINYTAAELFANFSAVVLTRLDHAEQFASSVSSATTATASDLRSMNLTVRGLDQSLRREIGDAEARASSSADVLNRTWASRLGYVDTLVAGNRDAVAFLNATLRETIKTSDQARQDLRDQIHAQDFAQDARWSANLTAQSQRLGDLIADANALSKAENQNALDSALSASATAAAEARASLASSVDVQLAQHANSVVAVENRALALEGSATSADQRIALSEAKAGRLAAQLLSLQQRAIRAVLPFGVSKLTAGVADQHVHVDGAVLGDVVSLLAHKEAEMGPLNRSAADCNLAEKALTLIESTTAGSSSNDGAAGGRLVLAALSPSRDANVSYALCLGGVLQVAVPLIAIHAPAHAGVSVPSHSPVGVVTGAIRAVLLFSGTSRAISFLNNATTAAEASVLGCVNDPARVVASENTTTLRHSASTLAWVPPALLPGTFRVCADDNLQPVVLHVVPRRIRSSVSQFQDSRGSLRLELIDLVPGKSNVAILPADAVNCEGAHAESQAQGLYALPPSRVVLNLTSAGNASKVCYSELGDAAIGDESYADEGILVSAAAARVRMPVDVIVGTDQASRSSAPSTSQIENIVGVAVDAERGCIYLADMKRNQIILVKGGLRRSPGDGDDGVSVFPVAQGLELVAQLAFDGNDLFAVSRHDGRGRLLRIVRPDASSSPAVRVVAEAEEKTRWVNVAVDAAGESLYVLDEDGKLLRIRERTAEGQEPEVTILATGIAVTSHAGVCAPDDAPGEVFVTEMTTGILYKIGAAGQKIVVATGLVSPTDCEVAGSTVLVTSLYPGFLWRVHRGGGGGDSDFSKRHGGRTSTELLTSGLEFPLGISLDARTGDLLVSEWGMKVNAAGAIEGEGSIGTLVRVESLE